MNNPHYNISKFIWKIDLFIIFVLLIHQYLEIQSLNLSFIKPNILFYLFSLISISILITVIDSVKYLKYNYQKYLINKSKVRMNDIKLILIENKI